MNIFFENARDSTELFAVLQRDQKEQFMRTLLIRSVNKNSIHNYNNGSNEYSQLTPKGKAIVFLINQALDANQIPYDESHVDTFINKLFHELGFFKFPLYFISKPDLFLTLKVCVKITE